MLGRRLFANCAICAVTAAVAAGGHEALAQAAPGGISRKTLTTTDMPGGKLVCIQMIADLDPGAQITRHTHPGIEAGYVMDGSATLSVKGEPDRTLKLGDGYAIPAETPHAALNGGQKTRLLITYTVEKDKPLASPAPA